MKKYYPLFNDAGFVSRANPYGFRLRTVHPYGHCVSKAAAGWRTTADPTRPTDPTSPPAPTPDSTADPSCPTDSTPDPAEDPTGPTDSTPRLVIKLRPKCRAAGSGPTVVQLALTDGVRAEAASAQLARRQHAPKLEPKQPACPPPARLLLKQESSTAHTATAAIITETTSASTADQRHQDSDSSSESDEFLRYIDSLPD